MHGKYYCLSNDEFISIQNTGYTLLLQQIQERCAWHGLIDFSSYNSGGIVMLEEEYRANPLSNLTV